MYNTVLMSETVTETEKETETETDRQITGRIIKKTRQY